MNYLMYGKPGSGKTTSACTNPNKPILLFDIDNKANRMKNIEHLVKKGDVIIKPFNVPLMEDKLRDRVLNPDKALKFQPEGYLAMIDFLSSILDGKIDPEYAQCKTLVIDSFTRLLEHMKRLLVHLRGQGKMGKKSKDEGDMNWPSWGSYLSNLEELLTALVTIKDMDLIVTAHEKVETEKDLTTDTSTVIGIWPLVEGSMMKKISGYFDEVYYLNPVITTKKAEYRFQTRGSLLCCRSSMNLETFEEADLNLILKKGNVL